jgi:hypothetical protein
MGIEHWLVDEQHNRAYLLGKGYWGDVFAAGIPADPLQLRSRMIAMWRNWDPADVDCIEYVNSIACEAWGFIKSAGQLKLRSDARVGDEVGDVPVVGSRYGGYVAVDPCAALSERYRSEAAAALGIIDPPTAAP